METIKCSQCERPSIVKIGEIPLCVECFSKFQHALSIKRAEELAEINFLIGQAELATGMFGVIPKYEIPQPVIHRGAMNINNIRVDKSNVGVINTGEIQNIEIARNFINDSGNKELTEAIRAFTEAVINETKLDDEIRKNLIEMIAFVSSQATLAKEKQKKSLIKSILNSVKDTVTTLSAFGQIITTWEKLAPLFYGFFGFL